MGLFSSKIKKDQDDALHQSNSNSESAAVDARNWYSDRYQSLIVQRNFLFFIAILSLVVVIVSVFFISQLTLQKNIVPLVVEVEDKTGITYAVNPETNIKWTESTSINRYFLMKYLRARETYNVIDYIYNYNTIVRLLSSAQIYGEFTSYLNNKDTSPIVKYGSSNDTTLQLRSIQMLKDDPTSKTAQVRFTVKEQSGARKSYNKILLVAWSYKEISLNFNDRMVNPLGFQITSYSLTEDING